MGLIPVVYAKVNATQARPDGSSVPVYRGQPWWTQDPFVLQYPWMFSSDPRWGLRSTVVPDGWDDPPVPEDSDEPPVVARARARAAT